MNIEYHNGSDPLGLCRYLLDPKKQRDKHDSPIISSNMAGRDVEELAEEFRFSHDTNPNIKITMRHFAISFQPGEKVDREKMAAIFKRLYEMTGHQHCLYLNAQHHDKENESEVEHGHGAVCANDKDGNWVDDAHIITRLKYGLGQEKSIERCLEEEFGLQPYIFRPERDRHNLPTGEYRMKQRLEIEQTPTEQLWKQIQETTEDKPTFAVMAARLKTRGIGVQFKEVDDEVVGISFEVDGALRKGKDLGRQYSFGGLQRNGFVQQYDESQTQKLREIQQATFEQCQQFLDTHPRQLQKLELDRSRQKYIFNRQKPKHGSVQWSRAEAMLNCFENRINDAEDFELEDDQLSAKWNEETQQMIVLAKGDPNQIILQGKAQGENGWNILHADISLGNWRHFQKKMRETTAGQYQIEDRSLSRSTKTQTYDRNSPELG